MYIYVYIYTYSTLGRGDGLRDRGAVSERLMGSEWTAEWFMDAFRVTEGLSGALYPLWSSRQSLGRHCHAVVVSLLLRDGVDPLDFVHLRQLRWTTSARKNLFADPSFPVKIFSFLK